MPVRHGGTYTRPAPQPADSPAKSTGLSGDVAEGAAGAAAPSNTQGASGTAREAPSAGSGDASDEGASGTQSAPLSSSPEPSRQRRGVSTKD